ncbi:hypothetical protein [Paenimyroides tangerinum]|nr:hypothetical protein [Paenimyroides tangerinum]
MTKNYSKEKIESKEPNQSVIDFILNYSKALHICVDSKVETAIFLN